MTSHSKKKWFVLLHVQDARKDIIGNLCCLTDSFYQEGFFEHIRQSSPAIYFFENEFVNAHIDNQMICAFENSIQSGIYHM